MPFFDQHGIRLLRVLTDRGTEYCGNPQHHEYELYLALEDIDHTRTRAKSPQTNGIVERLHKTMLNEFYRIVFRKKIYDTIDALQTDSLNLISGRCVFKRPEPALCSGGTRLNTALPAPSFPPAVARSKHLARSCRMQPGAPAW